MEMSSYENPFDFIKDNKKFIQSLEEKVDDSVAMEKKGTYQGVKDTHDRLYLHTNKAAKYGLIKRLVDDAKQMTVEQKLRLPIVNRNRNNIFKEKRESLDQFIQNKRNIFVQSMRISVKKDQTVKLDELLRNEEESLRARELDIQKDQDLIKQFIHNVKVDADNVQEKTDAESLKTDLLNNRIIKLQVEIEKLKNQKDKDLDELDHLMNYKGFIDELWSKFKITNQQSDEEEQEGEQNQNMFITDNQKERKNSEQPFQKIEYKKDIVNDIVLPFTEPEQIPELLDLIEEKNLNYITTQAEWQEDLDKIIKECKSLQEQYQQLKLSNKQKIENLNKQMEQQQRVSQQLQNLQILDAKVVELDDEQQINMNTVCGKINDIYREMNMINDSKSIDVQIKSSQKKDFQPKDILFQLKTIEIQFQKMIQKQQKMKSNDYVNKNFYKDAEDKIAKQFKELRKEKDQQTAMENQQAQQMLQMQKQNEKQKVRYGRKDMKRSHILKDEVVVEEETEESEDDDEKYFKENYEMK